MPPLESLGRHQLATLWEVARFDRNSRPLLSSPIALTVRWEEGRVDMMDANGQLIKVDVTMHSTRDIPLGSLACESDATQGTAVPDTGIYEVVTRDFATDIKGRNTRYEYGLKRFMDSLPEVVS